MINNYSDIQQDVKDEIESYASNAKYGIAQIPAHAHTGVDSDRVDYNNLTNIPSKASSVPIVLQTTRAMDTASGTVSIAHGIGVIPKFVTVRVDYADYSIYVSTPLQRTLNSNGFSDGTNNYCQGVSDGGYYSTNPNPPIAYSVQDASNAIYLRMANQNGDGGYNNTYRVQSATITLDSTNVNIIWTKTDSGHTSNQTGTFNIQILVYK
jgi:hypothetical protein